MHRHNWTKQQDSSLINVVAKMGCEDWTRNSQKLKQESQIARINNRSGKQCRERWYNHLDPNIKKSGWTEEQEVKLFQAQKAYGNKWKQICSQLPGRTDNDVKNRFYSTLRRSLRRLNKYIGQKNSTSQMRQIKPSVLTSIIKTIYEQSNLDNADLLGELKELPELIFKFSTFKPVKNNMNSKIDTEMRDRISLILDLVEKFRNSCEPRRKTGSTKKQTLKIEESREDQQVFIKTQEGIQGISSQQSIQSENQESDEQLSDEEQYADKMDLSDIFMSSNKKKLGFPRDITPIVTIRRKSSTISQATKKKIEEEQRPKSNIKAYEDLMLDMGDGEPPNLFEDQENGVMVSIQEPSISFQEQFLDLVVVGKHMQPIQYEGNSQENEHFNEEEIDEVLQENYQ